MQLENTLLIFSSLEYFLPLPTPLKVSSLKLRDLGHLFATVPPTPAHCWTCNRYSIHIWWFNCIITKEWFPVLNQGPTGPTRPLFDFNPHLNATRFIGSLLGSELKSPSFLHGQVNLLALVSSSSHFLSSLTSETQPLQFGPCLFHWHTIVNTVWMFDPLN